MARLGLALRTLPVATAALLGLACAWLLLRTLHVGQTQSYDTLLYARSLWGVWAGEPFNPVYGTHWLGIHANGVLLVLAPLCALLEPAHVLVGAQALAFAGTLASIGAAVQRSALAAGLGARAATVQAMAAVLACGLGSALVANPFLFDARPESLGAFFGAWACIRLVERARWDLGVTLGMLAAVACREEFVLVALSALALAVRPSQPPVSDTESSILDRAAARDDAATKSDVAPAWTWPVVTTVIAVGWAALYVLWLRAWVDGGFAGSRADQAAGDLFGWGGADAWTYRALVLGAFAAAGAGALALAPRAWLASAPALAFVLAIDKGGVDALRYHYALLLVPTLAAGVVLGHRAWLNSAPSRRRALGVAGLALMLIQGATLTTWPGSRFFDGTWAGLGADAQAAAPTLAATRALIARIPPGAGVALPYMLASLEADRAVIYSEETLLRHLTEHRAAPEGVDWVLLPPHQRGRARWLTANADFVLAADVPRAADLLGRWSVTGLQAGIRERIALANVPCDTPLARFSAHGLVVCSVTRSEIDERLDVMLATTGDADPARAPVALIAINDEMASPVRCLEGLVDLRMLPPGVWALRSDQPWVSGAQPRWQLMTLDGQTVAPDP